jgi:hypothetical protein
VTLGMREVGIAKERPRSLSYGARSSGSMQGRLYGSPPSGSQRDPCEFGDVFDDRTRCESETYLLRHVIPNTSGGLALSPPYSRSMVSVSSIVFEISFSSASLLRLGHSASMSSSSWTNDNPVTIEASSTARS